MISSSKLYFRCTSLNAGKSMTEINLLKLLPTYLSRVSTLIQNTTPVKVQLRMACSFLFARWDAPRYNKPYLHIIGKVNTPVVDIPKKVALQFNS